MIHYSIFGRVKLRVLMYLVVALYICGIIYLIKSGFLSHTFTFDLTLVFGILLIPYVALLDNFRYSFRYLIPLIVCLLLALVVPVKSLYFLILILGGLLMVESMIGRTSFLLLYLLLILSPVFNYANAVFGFSLRLILSRVAGIILSVADGEVKVTGNVISIDGSEFMIDPACAGLSMMQITFILACFITAYNQKRFCKRLSAVTLMSFFVITLLLNLLSNLGRIVLIAFFKVFPGTVGHDIIGVACLCIYVCVPLFWLSRALFKHAGKSFTASPETKQPGRKQFVVNFLILSLIVLTAFRIAPVKMKPIKGDLYSLRGFKKEMLKDAVVKYDNGKLLIYLKPMEYYSAEHNPMFCWTGSGYIFERYSVATINSRQIYTGVLIKESEKIYTAWWFDNGNKSTINQLNWRWDALQHDTRYCLVNVTARTPDELIEEVKTLLR